MAYEPTGRSKREPRAGIMLGPLIAGAAITLLDGPFASTHGYAAMWAVVALSLAASVPFLLRMGRPGRW